jgi:hypothetical protein
MNEGGSFEPKDQFRHILYQRPISRAKIGCTGPMMLALHRRAVVG